MTYFDRERREISELIQSAKILSRERREISELIKSAKILRRKRTINNFFWNFQIFERRFPITEIYITAALLHPKFLYLNPVIDAELMIDNIEIQKDVQMNIHI